MCWFSLYVPSHMLALLHRVSVRRKRYNKGRCWLRTDALRAWQLCPLQEDAVPAHGGEDAGRRKGARAGTDGGGSGGGGADGRHNRAGTKRKGGAWDEGPPGLKAARAGGH